MSEPKENRNSPPTVESGNTVTSSFEQIDAGQSRIGSEEHGQFISAMNSTSIDNVLIPDTDADPPENIGPHTLLMTPPLTKHGRRELRHDEQGYFFIDQDTGAEIRFRQHWTSDGSNHAPSVVTQASPTPAHGVPGWIPHAIALPDSRSNSSKQSSGTGIYADLVLDIDPETLNHEQLVQLSAIRTQLGLGSEGLRISTAMMSEHQRNIEQTHDAIQALREETSSRLLSINNKVNDQRSRLNRCLDDNLRVLRDSGLAEAQLKEIMDNRGSRHTRDVPPHIPLAKAQAVTIPVDVRQEMDQTIPPRRDKESPQEFFVRGEAMGRTKERAHSAFAQPYTKAHACHVLPQATNIDYPLRRTSFGPDVGSISTTKIPCETRRIQNIGIHQTTSAYRAGMTGNLNEDAGDLMADFDAETYDAIIRTIESRVGREPEPLPSGVRAPRLDSPPKYSGSNNHDDFIAWLEKWLGWLRSQNICGPQTENYRITLLGLVLDGPAHDWFIEEVDNPRADDDAESYSFSDALCALHRRFVHFSTAHQCAKKFDSCIYTPADGPEGYYNTLLKYAVCMRERPTEYAIHKRLMDGYPAWIHNDLVRNRSITAEFSSVMSIRTHARQLWESASLMRKDTKDPAVATASAAPISATTSHLPRPANSRSRPPHHPMSSSLKPAAPVAPAREDRGPIPRLPPAPTAKTCYTCGLVGHFANDPQCPKYNERAKPRFAAQRINDIDDNLSDGDDNGQGSWGGSQYTSAEEDTHLEDSPEDELHDDITVRLGAMRSTPLEPFIRCNMMRVEELESWMTSSRRVAYDSQGNVFEAPDLQLPCSTCGRCEPVLRFIDVTEEDTLFAPHWMQICEHLVYLGHPDQVELPGSESDDDSDSDHPPTMDDPNILDSDSDDLPDLQSFPPSAPVSDSDDSNDGAPHQQLLTDAGRPITSWTRTIVNYRNQAGPSTDTFSVNAEIVQYADDRIFRLCTGLGWTDWYTESHAALSPHPSENVNAPLRDRIPTVAMLNNSHSFTSLNAQLVLLSENEYTALAHAIDDYHYRVRRQVFATRIIHSSTIRRRTPQDDSQPDRLPHELVCLTAAIELNGVQAYVLFDSGSTTDSISPEFAHATRAPRIMLKEQIVLQLGCVGSKLKINFGTRIPISIGSIKDTIYFDIVNLDRYDCIIGTPFLNKYGASLDFGTRVIRFKNGSSITAHSVNEERDYLITRNNASRARAPNTSAAPNPRDQPPHFRGRASDHIPN